MFDRIISRWLPWSLTQSLTKFGTKQKRKLPCVEIKYDLIEHIIGGDTPCLFLMSEIKTFQKQLETTSIKEDTRFRT